MRLRLFLTCWVLFSLHFATDFVREHYLALSVAEAGSVDLSEYYGLHEDIFRNPPDAPRGGVHHGANPGISLLAAVPVFALRPAVDRIVARALAGRPAGSDSTVVYDDPRQMRVLFYRQAYARGLDIKFGLVGIITMVLCMAPLSALGVVGVHRLLEGAGLTARLSLGLSLVYAFGTPVLFRTAYLNQNLAIGIVGLLAFYLLWNPGGRLAMAEGRRTVLAGGLAGFGLLCDYSGGLTLALLGLYALARARESSGGIGGVVRTGALYTAGALPMIVALWVYQWAAFGHPFLPPQHWMPAVIYSDQGYQGVTGPNLGLLMQLLFHPSFGLLVSAPLLVLAIGAPFVVRSGRSFLPARELTLCLGIAAAYLIFFSAIAYTQLQWSTGIRYMMPAVPFLFLAAATVLVRLPRGVAFGIVTMAVTVAWSMAMVRNQYGVHQNLIRVFVEGFQLPWLTTLGKMASQYAPWLAGRPSALPVMVLTAAVVWGIWAVRDPRKPAFAGPESGTEKPAATA